MIDLLQEQVVHVGLDLRDRLELGKRSRRRQATGQLQNQGFNCRNVSQTECLGLLQDGGRDLNLDRVVATNIRRIDVLTNRLGSLARSCI